MKKMYAGLLILLLTGMASIANAQDESVMISGVVMDADSVGIVPYVNIRLKGTFFGTVSDNTGRFNFFASEGDTLHFSSIGYFDAYFIMPEKMEGDSYSLIQLMRKETIMLDEVVVFPWPEYDQLKRAFVNAKLRRSMKDVSDQATKKIKRISRQEYESNKHYYNVYYNNQLYDMTGIVPANDFINPMQWSNFIKDVRNKNFRKEKK